MAQVLGLAEFVSVLATPRKMIILLYAFRWNCTLARLLAQDNADGPSRAPRYYSQKCCSWSF